MAIVDGDGRHARKRLFLSNLDIQAGNKREGIRGVIWQASIVQIAATGALCTDEAVNTVGDQRCPRITCTKLMAENLLNSFAELVKPLVSVSRSNA